MLKILLLIPLGISLFIAYRIYAFLRATNAPILQGKRHFSVRYKSGHKLDIYQPTNRLFAKSPVLVYFHGGAWLTGTRKAMNSARFTPAFNALREQGYAIVAPSYSVAKVGKSPFPACLEDATDALVWLAKHADKYGFDLDNVGLMGESAGAHVAMMTAYSPNDTFSQGHPITVRYLIDIYGPADMPALYHDLLPMLERMSERTSTWPNLLRQRFNVVEKLFGFDPVAEPERAAAFTQRFSPVNYLTAAAPPTLMIHGTRDRVVPFRQSSLLEERMLEVGAAYERYQLPGVGHSLRGISAEQYQQIQEWVMTFVKEHSQLALTASHQGMQNT